MVDLISVQFSSRGHDQLADNNTIFSEKTNTEIQGVQKTVSSQEFSDHSVRDGMQWIGKYAHFRGHIIREGKREREREREREQQSSGPTER